MQAFEGTFATLIQKVRAYINVGATQTQRSYCILRYLTSVEFADALMTEAGGDGDGNLNRLDTFNVATAGFW